jgi:hypothetical protein
MRVTEFSGNMNQSHNSPLQTNRFDKTVKKKSALDTLRKKIRMIMMIKSAYSKDSKQKLVPMDKEEK